MYPQVTSLTGTLVWTNSIRRGSAGGRRTGHREHAASAALVAAHAVVARRDVRALGGRTRFGGRAAAPRNPAGPPRRRDLRRARPVPDASDRPGARPRPALRRHVLRNQRPALLGGRRRAARSGVPVARREQAGAGARRPVQRAAPLRVVTDAAASRRGRAHLRVPPEMAGPARRRQPGRRTSGAGDRAERDGDVPDRALGAAPALARPDAVPAQRTPAVAAPPGRTAGPGRRPGGRGRVVPDRRAGERAPLPRRARAVRHPGGVQARRADDAQKPRMTSRPISRASISRSTSPVPTVGRCPPNTTFTANGTMKGR